MKVIILKKVKGMGEIGSIKDVTDGYALNFLIPQKIAEPATAGNIARLKKKQATEVKQIDHELILSQKKAKQLASIVIKIKGKCNSEGKLYSAIGIDHLADELKAKGIDIEPRQINLTKPIKELGQYSIVIILSQGIESKIKVIITE